jgi:hypothetical protein
MVPISLTIRLSDMRNARRRVCSAYRLAAELLAIFGINQPAMLKHDGSTDPYGVATDQQQLVYQHARHIGLPVDETSPSERHQQYEEALRAAEGLLLKRDHQ